MFRKSGIITCRGLEPFVTPINMEFGRTTPTKEVKAVPEAWMLTNGACCTKGGFRTMKENTYVTSWSTTASASTRSVRVSLFHCPVLAAVPFVNRRFPPLPPGDDNKETDGSTIAPKNPAMIMDDSSLPLRSKFKAICTVIMLFWFEKG